MASTEWTRHLIRTWTRAWRAIAQMLFLKNEGYNFSNKLEKLKENCKQALMFNRH
jgi:hypothetical protein